MEQIEVGEYVRDKEGHITKVIGTLSLFKDVELYLGEDDYQYSDNAIAKHSKNIIDLIEVGDYVNGKLVSNVDKVDNMNFIEWDDGDMYKTEIPNDKFIKSIVTKEQFASMEYKVGE